MTTRADLQARQSELATERRRGAALRVELGRLGEIRSAPRAAAWAIGLLALAALAATFAVRELRRPPHIPPSALEEQKARQRALIAERDELRAARPASLAPEPTAPPPAPAALGPETYPALATARDALGSDPEDLIAWAQVAMAACTVGEELLARRLYGRQLFAAEADRHAGGGLMHPVRKAALGALDAHCRDHRIHLVVPLGAAHR